MRELTSLMKNDGPVLKRIQIMLQERFIQGYVLRSEYRLFMSQKFRIDREGSKEILKALEDAGFVRNGNRGIYIK